MEITQFIIIGIILVAGLVISLVYKRLVSQKALDPAQAESEAQKLSDSDLDVLINADFGVCIQHLDDKKVLGANYIYHLPDMKEHMKNAGKDVLKSALTLGTVKYTTVQVPMPLLLTADGLHLFELDVDGKVKRHLMFDNSRMENATLTPFANDRVPQELGDSAKFYKLQVPSEDGVREITLCTVLYPTQQYYMAYDRYRRLLAYAVGKKFFKALEEKYPNLKA